MGSLLKLSNEELVARAIAPIKREYIVPCTARSNADGAQGNGAAAMVADQKKSGKQKKRVRAAH